MDWIWPGQDPGPWHFKHWCSRITDPRLASPPAHRYQDSYRRVLGRSDAAGFERVAEAILRYDVFPRDLGSGCRWPASPTQAVVKGETVYFCWRFVAGIRLLFGCRVKEVFRDKDRAGFTYQTLVHHPELGEETFEVVRNKDDLLVVHLSCWSVPGTWLARMTAPLARYWQVQGARRILDHLEEVYLYSKLLK